MTSVTFNGISKYYGNFAAVNDLNLTVEDQEFLVLVGPSGCGKTTSLRMLAGLEDISAGTILIGDRTVNEEPPKARDIAMVFQSYALYPHWTIYDNLAFGLRMRNVSFKQNFLVFLLQAILYSIILGLFYGFSYLVEFFLPNVGALVFISGLIGAIVTLIMFAEVRHDLRRFILNLKLFPLLVNMAEVENDIEMKVKETSELLGIHEQLFKKPKQLSGGQRQRVALGRAIIRAPEVFLMDEPLSNLDAKLRVQMRAELQRMQKRLKTTTIYVTHDQIEAMTLADRIAIMNEGVLQQVGTPDEVYTTPVNKFVAGFIGSPSMNFSDGKIIEDEGELHFECKAFKYPVPEQFSKMLRKNFVNRSVWLGIRPEHIQLSENSNTIGKVNATVGVLEPIGSDTYVYIDFPKEVSMIVKVEGASSFKLDQNLDVTFLPEHIHFFNFETGIRLFPEEKAEREIGW